LVGSPALIFHTDAVETFPNYFSSHHDASSSCPVSEQSLAGNPMRARDGTGGNMSHFNGEAYNQLLDHARLTKQHERIKSAMLDERWRTLDEIAQITGDPAASISAQLRHLRKPRFGSHVVEKRRRGDPSLGLYEYRVLRPRTAPNFDQEGQGLFALGA
jgi:hypothetical protein